jgi:hypothetical protein
VGLASGASRHRIVVAGTNESLPGVRAGRILAGMIKRTIAGILWFFTAWTAWTFVAYAVGWPGTLGVVIGVAVAGVVVVDPWHRIWDRRAAVAVPSGEPEPEFA